MRSTLVKGQDLAPSVIGARSMTGDVQPDLFGGAHLVDASRATKREENAQLIGQTDVFSLLAEAQAVADDLWLEP